MQRAQAQADAVAEQFKIVEPAYRGFGLQFRLEPMQQYLVASVRPAILSLMGAVIFLLLVACSNVANLFLVPASLRGQDLAVRTALGASWWRLVRQMLAEAFLLSAMGSIVGCGLALVLVRELLAIAPANLPRFDATRIDPAVLAFSIAAGLAAAVLFGLVPAMQAGRPDVAQVLRAAGRTSGLSGGALLRNAVVVVEVFRAARGLRPDASELPVVAAENNPQVRHVIRGSGARGEGVSERQRGRSENPQPASDSHRTVVRNRGGGGARARTDVFYGRVFQSWMGDLVGGANAR
jgi:hypothetical protein